MIVKELWDANAFSQPVGYKFRCKISHLVGQHCRVDKLNAFQCIVAALPRIRPLAFVDRNLLRIPAQNLSNVEGFYIL